MGLKHLALLAVAPLCLASPLSLVPRQAAAAPLPPWDAGGVPEFPIHASCNNSEVIQLQKHLKDMKMVANHAIDRILRYGNGSELFVKWFGASPTAQPIGWYERIARADRAGFQFRCDDPDGFCGPPEWSGYWRGIDVAPEDVAICPRAFELLPLEGLCTRSYTLANWDITLVMVTDLMHRLLHVPSVSELVVEHYGNGYIGSLDLAESNPEEAVINSDSLQYFALEAWAVDFSVPGIGCVGNETVARDLYESSMSMESASAAATATAASSTAGTQAPSTTTAASACHTHANGEVHCT